MTRWRLDWPHGSAELTAQGGLLGPVTFRLGHGRTVQPMYLAPWLNDPATRDLPPLLRDLKGELPCVPFGRTDFPEGLQNWTRRDPGDDWEHGYSANQPWSLITADKDLIRIGLDYPAASPIRRLERQISADPEAAALDISLTIFPRANAVVPVALHPTFRVPPDGIDLRPGPFARAVAYPVPAEPGVSRLTPGGIAPDLSSLPAGDGTLDLRHLPLPIKTEELLQLEACQPPFSLYYRSEQVEVSLSWDQQKLPDVMLWVSNAGRAAFPWNSRNYALGVEPVNGAFDLGRVAAPPEGHPFVQRQGLALKKDQPLRIDYRLSAR
ncbi:aldose epimerase family protein [Dongia rigui]|uniref:Aldose 1-epimerase n=1 Tax=Dongia rigui TaxID=940149 RepID=A0ABU5E329_9PROT|nr:hypothetical protein [Dongia rigui]MDY0873998.1 hypothetical protein [Dongia rigui]